MDIVVFVGLSVVLLLGMALPLITLHSARFSEAALLRRRLQTLGPGARDASGGADLNSRNRQRLIQRKLQEMEGQRARRKDSLDTLLRQSGLSLSIGGYIGLCLGAGLISGGGLLMLDMEPLVCLAGAAGGDGLGVSRGIYRQ